MIIKRSLKSVMPTLKRCRGGDSAAGEDEDSSENRKRRKLNGYYPLHLLGEVAAGIIPFRGYGGIGFGGVAAAAWCSEVASCCPEDDAEEESKPKAREDRSGKPEAPRPPALVRTARGRVQVLPSKFNDSVLDNWKKEKSKASSVQEWSMDPEFPPHGDNKFNSKNPKIRGQVVNKQRNGDKVGYQYGKLSSLLVEDGEEFRNREFKSLVDIRNYSTSHRPLTSFPKQLLHAEKSSIGKLEGGIHSNGTDTSSKEVKRKSGVYGPEDFVAGDIVWAMSGDNYPAWPAIVLDLRTQIPQQVLNFQVADAVCVMFFGYSGNGTQRVVITFFCTLIF